MIYLIVVFSFSVSTDSDVKFIDEDIDRIIEDDEEEWPPSPTGISNGGPNWPPELSSERAKRSPSATPVPNKPQTQNMRQRKHRPTMADITMDGSGFILYKIYNCNFSDGSDN